MMRVVKRLLAGIMAGTIILSSVAVAITSYDDDGVAIVNEDDERCPDYRKIQ